MSFEEKRKSAEVARETSISSSSGVSESLVDHSDDNGLSRISTEKSTQYQTVVSRHASRVTTHHSESLSRRCTNLGTTTTTDPDFEVDWDDEDTHNPRTWPLWYKGFAIGTVSWATWVA